MADSFSKKEREKKKKKKNQDKLERRKQRKLEEKKTEEIMYLDANGNFTSTPPDPNQKKEVSIEEIWVSTPKKSDLESQEKEREGFVKFFNEEKRFGFISEIGQETDYFVHEDNLIDPIKGNDKVVFEIGSGPKGPIAINVRLLKNKE